MGKPISECTFRELKSKAEFLKKILIVFSVLLAILVIWIIYRMATGERVIIGAVLPAVVAILGGTFPAYSGLASIKKEVQNRLSKRR